MIVLFAGASAISCVYIQYGVSAPAEDGRRNTDPFEHNAANTTTDLLTGTEWTTDTWDKGHGTWCGL